YIKNIDNVTPEHLMGATAYWKKVLGGHLIMVQDEIFKCLGLLAAKKIRPGVLPKIVAFARKELNLDLGQGFSRLPIAQKIHRLKKALNRPIRVCGVVPNTGEPGGGPFWV